MKEASVRQIHERLCSYPKGHGYTTLLENSVQIMHAKVWITLEDEQESLDILS